MFYPIRLSWKYCDVNEVCYMDKNYEQYLFVLLGRQKNDLCNYWLLMNSHYTQALTTMCSYWFSR